MPLISSTARAIVSTTILFPLEQRGDGSPLGGNCADYTSRSDCAGAELAR